MIPREIPCKVRQIELCTNRLVCDPSFQPSLEFGGIARAVEHRNHTDKIRFDVEIDAVFVEDFHPCLANRLATERKTFGAFKNPLESGVNPGLKPVSQPWLPPVIPGNRLLKFNPGLSAENYLPSQAPFLFDRLLSSARTFSHVVPFSGWRRSFSARRSNSAICSGVNSSSNSSRIRWRTSHCSSKGNRRNCSRMSAALMSGLYLFDPTFAIRNFT